MNIETIAVIAEAACGTVLIARSEQEALNLKKTMIRVASSAVKETEELDKQAIDFYQQRYLSSLEEDAEKEAVKKAFDSVLAAFIEDKKKIDK